MILFQLERITLFETCITCIGAKKNCNAFQSTRIKRRYNLTSLRGLSATLNSLIGIKCIQMRLSAKALSWHSQMRGGQLPVQVTDSDNFIKMELTDLCAASTVQVSINSLNGTKVVAHVHLCHLQAFWQCWLKCKTLVEQISSKKIASEHRVPRILHHWVPRPSPSDAKVLNPRNLKIWEKFVVDPLWSCLVCCLLPVPQPHPRLEPITPANAAKKSPEMVVNLDDSSYAWLNAYMVGIRHSSEIQNVLVGQNSTGTV